MLLNDKVAIVTGGANGIGRAIVRRFVREGARVIIADIDDAGGAAATEQFASAGSVRYVRTDIGDRGDVVRMVAASIGEFGRIDVLVNNAGVLKVAAFLELDEADFDRVLRVNLKGAFLCSQMVARHMVERVKSGEKPGAIVNLSSVNAVLAIANQVPYSVSKGALNQLTKVTSLALAPHGIRVNGIGPGSIATEMLATIMVNAEARQRILSRTPLGRVGEPEEIAAIAAFLASDEASYITGQTIYADGGRLPLNYTVPVRE